VLAIYKTGRDPEDTDTPILRSSDAIITTRCSNHRVASSMDQAETAWRAKKLEELTKNAGIPAAQAQVLIERWALWEPWQAITVRFPTLQNLEKFRK
jgi:hypothetical protein